MHPGAAIESSLQLHAGTAHGRLNLLALDPVNHTFPANRVILAYRTALPNAQHGIQIRFWPHRTVGIARQLRLATKAPVPKRHKHLLQIGVGRRQVLGTHLSQPLHQPVLGGLKRTLNAPLGLRGMGRDPLDVQLLQRPANLGQLLFRIIPVMVGPGAI